MGKTKITELNALPIEAVKSGMSDVQKKLLDSLYFLDNMEKAKENNGWFFKSDVKLAELAGIQPRTMKNARAFLERNGLIEVVPGKKKANPKEEGTATSYRLNKENILGWCKEHLGNRDDALPRLEIDELKKKLREQNKAFKLEINRLHEEMQELWETLELFARDYALHNGNASYCTADTDTEIYKKLKDNDVTKVTSSPEDLTIIENKKEDNDVTKVTRGPVDLPKIEKKKEDDDMAKVASGPVVIPDSNNFKNKIDMKKLKKDDGIQSTTGPICENSSMGKKDDCPNASNLPSNDSRKKEDDAGQKTTGPIDTTDEAPNTNPQEKEKKERCVEDEGPQETTSTVETSQPSTSTKKDDAGWEWEFDEGTKAYYDEQLKWEKELEDDGRRKREYCEKYNRLFDEADSLIHQVNDTQTYYQHMEAIKQRLYDLEKMHVLQQISQPMYSRCQRTIFVYWREREKYSNEGVGYKGGKGGKGRRADKRPLASNKPVSDTFSHSTDSCTGQEGKAAENALDETMRKIHNEAFNGSGEFDEKYFRWMYGELFKHYEDGEYGIEEYKRVLKGYADNHKGDESLINDMMYEAMCCVNPMYAMEARG